MPSENVPVRLPATSLSPTVESTSSTRLAAIPLLRAIASRCLPALRPGCMAFASSSAPTSRSGNRSSAYGLPRISASPESGRSSPTVIRMVVDLPAPFGPRNPVTVPVSMTEVRPLTTVFWP